MNEVKTGKKSVLSLFSPTFNRWVVRIKQWLRDSRPPFRDWHFWAVQGLIVVIAAAHYFLEVQGITSELARLYFVPVSLLVLPAVYAAVNFGRMGSTFTALWIIAISFPGLFLRHEGLERWGEMFQILIISSIGIFMGQRVDREREARQRATDYSIRLIRAQEEERRHVSHNLHDGIIQNMSMISRRLGGMETSVYTNRDAEVQEIKEIRDMVKNALMELRDFTRSLRPPILDDLGLSASIRRLTVDLSERSGIRSKYTMTGAERRFQPELEVNIFRIVQEALRNVESHAKATSVEVSVNFNPNTIKLEIKDNGVGFNRREQPAVGAAGLGLIGMQERTEMFSGKLIVNSRPGEGTVISVIIPIPKGSIQ